MTLTFVYPICTGLIDVSERLEASAKRVLLGMQHSSSNNSGSGSGKCNRTKPSRFKAQPIADVCGQPSQPATNILQHRLLQCSNCMRCAWQEVVHREQQWLQPLLRLLLVQPGLQAMQRAVLVDLPAVLSSRESELHALFGRFRLLCVYRTASPDMTVEHRCSQPLSPSAKV